MEHFLQGYDCDVKNKLIQRFSFGFKINSVIEKADQKFPNNHRSARKNPEVVVQNINKEILKGRIRGSFKHPPFDNFICFPLGLVPKEESGSFRLIHDLSFSKGGSVNFWTPPEYTLVLYQNIETVIELVQENGFKCLMSKADIQDAFRLIPIHPTEYHLLGFQWDGQFYHDAALPMGASASCQLFESFSTVLQWILNEKCQIKGASHLLGDFFCVGEANTNKCSVALNTFLALAETLGVPIKSEKMQ